MKKGSQVDNKDIENELGSENRGDKNKLAHNDTVTVTKEGKPPLDLNDHITHEPSILENAKKLDAPQWVLEMIEGTDEYVVLIGMRQLLYANQIIGINQDKHNNVWLRFSLPRFRKFPENTTHMILNNLVPNREANFSLQEITGAMPFTCRHDGWQHHDKCGDCGKFTDDIYEIANAPIKATDKFNQVEENVSDMEFKIDEHVLVKNSNGGTAYGHVEAMDPVTKTYKIKLVDDQGMYWYKGVELAHIPAETLPERSTIYDGVEFKIGDKVTVQGISKAGEIVSFDLQKPKAYVTFIVYSSWYHLSKLMKVGDNAEA